MNTNICKYLLVSALIVFFSISALPQNAKAQPIDENIYNDQLAGLGSLLDSLKGFLNDVEEYIASRLEKAQAQSTLETGLVGHWKFDEGSGIIASDATSNSNTGTLVGTPTWTTGKIGGGLDFDGVDDYVDAGSGPTVDNLGPMTFSFWAYVRNIGVGPTYWYKSVDDGLQQRGNGTIAFSYQTSGTRLRRVTPNNFLAANQWTHIIVTWDGTSNPIGLHIYKNGQEASSYSISTGSGTPVNDSANNLTIGARTGGLQPANAILDEVRLYNRVLTATEIQELHNYTGTSPPTCTSFTYSTWSACQPDNTQTRTVLTSSPSGCTGGSPVTTQSCTYVPPPDTTPPVLSSGSPSGTLVSGTTQTTLSLTTNESATCKYSTTANTAYASMTNTFTTTGATSHSTTITGLQDGNTYNYYIRCQDTAGNQNTVDYAISFAVASAPPPVPSGSTHYIRQGATGLNNGSDWTNAWTSLPATLQRGHTYYIADGTYGSYTFDDPVSGTQYITVKKAILADYGTNVGWQNIYGDGQAVFSSFYFSSSYWEIDGQTGGGPGNWETGFGFVVHGPSGYKIRSNVSGVSYINISHVNVYNDDYQPGSSTFGGIVYAHAGNQNNWSFKNCWMHSVYGPVVHFSGADGWTFEYCKMGDNTGDSSHSEIMSALGNDFLTMRYNWFYRWRSTGGLVAINGPKGQVGDANICEDWKIYGNVFDQDGTRAPYIITAIHDASNDEYARRWKIHNNVFIGLESASTWVYGVKLSTTGEANNEFKNNIFYGNPDNIIISGAIEDYNSYQGVSNYFNGVNDAGLTSDPFVDFINKDYRLNASLSGVALGSTYNTDMAGNIRGADGVWDRGAFEYMSSSLATCESSGSCWYIDNAATGLNNGTSWTDAWQGFASINWAQIQPGDYIYISGGTTSKTYGGLKVQKSGTSAKPITIRSGQDAGHNGIVNINGRVNFHNYNWITLDGSYNGERHISITNPTWVCIDSIKAIGLKLYYLEIYNCGDSGNNEHAIWYNSYQGNITDSEIAYSHIHDIFQDGINVNQGLPGDRYGRLSIHHNTIERFGDDGIQAGAAVDIYDNIIRDQVSGKGPGHPDCYQGNGNHVRIYNNIISDCSNSMVFIETTGTSAGNWKIYNNLFYVDDMKPITTRGLALASKNCNGCTTSYSLVKWNDILIANNIFYNFYTYIGARLLKRPEVVQLDVTNARIANNIFYNNYINLSNETGSGGFAIENNNIFFADPTATCTISSGSPKTCNNGTPSNGIVKDPKFVDYINKDFHLQSTSPAIDGGINLSLHFTTDMEGKTRPQGINWDIGAYEYAGTYIPTSSPTSPTCTSFTYSVWSACQPDSTQIRTVTSSSPSGCTGGSPVTTQSCVYISSPSATFSIGDQVVVNASPSLRVRSSAGISDATILGVQPFGSLGTVVGGPVSLDGYTWWNIDYANAPDGWSIEVDSSAVYLAKYSLPSDITPPSTPTNLTATTVSSSQINLSWTVSTDNVGVTGYRIYRCQGAGCTSTQMIEINTSTTNSYSDTNLSPSTIYRYSVASYDATGNGSLASSIAQATTQVPPDTTAPVISSVSSSNITTNSASVSWITDEMADSQIEYGLTASYGTATNLDTNLLTSHLQTLTGLSANTTYHYRVKSKDSAGNTSVSTDQTFTTPGLPDTVSPSSISDLSTSFINHTSITINWTSPGDDGSTGTALSYDIRYSASPIATINWSSATELTGEPTPQAAGTAQYYTATGLSPSTTYYFALKTSDEAGNVSNISNIVSNTTHSLSVLECTSFTYSSWSACQADSTQTRTVTSSSPDPCTGGSPILSQSCIYTPPTPTSSPSPSAPTQGSGSPSGGGGGGAPSGGGYYFDTTPPQQPSDLTLTSADRQITLAWQNPKDSDFVRTTIFRSTPTTESASGELVSGQASPIPEGIVYSSAKDKYEIIYEGTDQEFTDTKLDNNTTYHYAIYAHDKKPNYTKPIIISAKPQAGKETIERPAPQPTPKPITTAITQTLSGPFSIGMKNEQVRLLQQMLATDKDIYPEQLTTGYYGTLTQRAVQRFQSKYGIVTSGTPQTTGYGLAGPKTRTKLNEIYGSSTKTGQVTSDRTLLIEQLKAQIAELQKQVSQLLEKINEALAKRGR